ncbi:unnamed protein product [Rhodiola kirilowii]
MPRPTEHISPPAPEEEQAGPEALGTSEQGALGPGQTSAPGTSRPGPTSAPETSRPGPARALKKYVMDKEVWELFNKVEINIPLLEAIKQIP